MIIEQEKFMLRSDLIFSVINLSDEIAGQLFKNILSLANGQEPFSENCIVNILIAPIKQSFKDVNRNKLNLSAKRRQAGKISAEAKKRNKQNQQNQQNQQPPTKSTNVNKSQQTSTNSTSVQSVEKPKINYQEIINVFNEICKDLPRASLTGDRRKKIDALLKTYTLEQIGLVFIKTSQSDYLTGKKVAWKASLSWLLKVENFTKVIEGNFDNLHIVKTESTTPLEQWKEVNDAVNKFYK